MSRSLDDSGRGPSNGDNLKRNAQSLVLNLGTPTEGIDEFFDPPLESKYECPICLLGLREPVQTQCGHRFCRNCIVRSLRDAGNKCPVDNVPLSESGLYPDNFAKREMGMFTVWCRHHKERNCPWKGHLIKLEEHLKDCPFSDVTCQNCSAVVLRKQLDEHKKICPKRKVVCEYCKNSVYFSEIKNHQKECPKYETICSKCKEKVTNEKLNYHREKVCPKEKVKCPLEFLGCKEENFIPEMNKHIKECFTSHFMDLANAVKNIQVQQSKAESQKPVAEGARGGYSGYPSETFLFETAVHGAADVKKLGERVTTLEKRVIDLEGRVSQGTFIWKIENYERCRQQAVNRSVTAIHSPPFFTSLYGYKMCLRVNLNGVDSGIDRHLSLFVHMMQGDWDDILEWPFTGRITLAILDQSDNVEYRRPISETLVAKPNLLAFQRPTIHRNHKGYGYVEFCQLEQITQGQFIKNDCMLIRVQVFH